MTQQKPQIQRRLRRADTLLAAAVAAMFLAGCGGSDDSDNNGGTPPAATLKMNVVSSQADYVTGGDALVEIELPAGTTTGTPVVTVNGRDVSTAFQRSTTGKFLGTVTQLNPGQNQLAAKLGDAAASLTLTNYPITGPMISGPHEAPFVCTLSTFGRLGGASLGNPLDADCSAKTRIDYFYRNTAGSNTRWVEPTTAPKTHPADMRYLTLNGKQVAYLVRLETGTINRGIYQSAILHDPLSDPAPSPLAKPAGWNGKLIYPLGGGCQGGWYTQGATFDTLIQDDWMTKGYAAVTSTLNIFGSNCNDLLSSETVAMTKERFSEAYGVPTYTIGTGGSGGAYQSHQTADNYPGLFDGIIVSMVFPDVTSSTLFKVFDSRLLNNYFNSSARTYTDAKKKAISGYRQVGNIANMSGSAGRLDPVVSFPTGFQSELRYDPVNNPGGVRATVYDHTVNVYGKDYRGFALRPIDNVGVQYGLKALTSGAISVDDFLDLNANVGGLDADLKPTAQRTVGDPGAIRRTYQSGRITNGGGGLASTPIIDRREYLDEAVGGDIHNKIHSYSMRERLQKANGNIKNHVIVGPGTIKDDTLGLMDKWLTTVIADTSAASKAVKVANGKPAELVDACWDAAGNKIIEPSTAYGAGQCNTLYPAGTTPRLVAGGPLADDVVKCQLKPVDMADYTGATFTPEQTTRLKAIFTGGVCDWTKPGVEQQGLKSTWVSFGPSKKNQIFDITNPVTNP